MSISIITVTYNSSKLIEKMLLSLLNQNYPLNKLEVIIVDNNSPDVSALKFILAKFRATNKKIKIIVKYRKGNYGFANSCNYGAIYAKGVNLLFLNPDTQVLKNSITILADHARAHKADIVGGLAHSRKNKSIHRTAFNYPSLRVMLLEFSNIGKLLNLNGKFYINQTSVENDIQVLGVGGGYFYVKNSVYKKLRGFDERFFMYLEDVDLCVRATQGGNKIIYCPHSKIYHVGGASSNNKHRILHSAWYESRELFLKKYYPLYVYIPIIFLYKIERILLQIREYILK